MFRWFVYIFRIAGIDVSADNALKIIDAYKGIVKAINEADDFSQDAVNKAQEALIDVRLITFIIIIYGERYGVGKFHELHNIFVKVSVC